MHTSKIRTTGMDKSRSTTLFAAITSLLADDKRLTDEPSISSKAEGATSLAHSDAAETKHACSAHVTFPGLFRATEMVAV